MTTDQNGNFTGKVAFVTGAAGGIGRACRAEASIRPMNTITNQKQKENVEQRLTG